MTTRWYDGRYGRHDGADGDGYGASRRHNQIRRTVTALPNGTRAVTESVDPEVAPLGAI
jgi:hypothetical protein